VGLKLIAHRIQPNEQFLAMERPKDITGEKMADDELVEAVLESRDKGNCEKADSLALSLIVERYGRLIGKIGTSVSDDRAKEETDIVHEVYFHLRTAREVVSR